MPGCPREKKDRGSNRKRPDSRQEEERAAAGVEVDSAAPTPRRSVPAASNNTNMADLPCSYFNVVARLFGSESISAGCRNPWEKNGPLKGEVSSGPVGKVLRGRRNCCTSYNVRQITSTTDYSDRSSSRAASCRPPCWSSGGHPRGDCRPGLPGSYSSPAACPCPAR